MAITIKKEKQDLSNDPGNLKTNEFLQNEIPATQGNVVNTIDAYNEQVKKHYYDKTETRGDTNALQESIMLIAKELDANTSFINKTINADETTDNVTSLSVLTKGDISKDTDDDNQLSTFTQLGLIAKIKILANLLSGSTDDGVQSWTQSSFGNNVGQSNIISNTPVVGKTREDTNYVASYNTIEATGKHELNISGLKKDTNNNDISSTVVLSEKQVSDMIKTSAERIITAYDNQIMSIIDLIKMLGYDVSEALKYAIIHSSEDDVFDAPLRVLRYDSGSNAYLIQTVSNALKNGNVYVEYTDLTQDLTDESGVWKLHPDDKLENLEVYRKIGDEFTRVYNIPVPQVAIKCNFGHSDNAKMSITNITVLGRDVSRDEVMYSASGVATMYVPIGVNAGIRIKAPSNRVTVCNNNDNFEKDSATTDKTIFVSKSVLTEDQTLKCGYYKYTLSPNGGNLESGTSVIESFYENEVFNLTTTVSRTGYKLKDKTNKGYNVTIGNSNKITITGKSLTEAVSDSLVWEKNSYNIQLQIPDVNETGIMLDTYKDWQIVSVSYNSSSNLPDPPDVRGYEFTGWKE